MFRTFQPGWLVLAVLAVGGTAAARAGLPNADTLRAGLRTANPSDEAYLIYVATLVDQRQLPADLVESTLLWARRKPHPKKFQYFKFALITRANQIGITLPQDTPALTGTIRGRVVARLLLVDVPVADVTITLERTKREATSDANGLFTFRNVPFGRYMLRAKGVVALLARTASAQVMVPSPPPSIDPVLVTLELK